MILSRYEETAIRNSSLPPSWRSQRGLEELEDFLQHNWDQRAVFYDDGRFDTKQQFLTFTGRGGVRTKNYIGTIAFAGEQLNIYPKMFRTEAEDQETDDLTQSHLMKNLIRWLEYCNRVSYPFINISTELSEAEDLRELFITLYVGYVRAAIERGLYYQYVEETEDISHIKGKFDFADYIVRKIPNGMSNKFRCSYSTFEFDNWVNRVIKYTCKQIINSTSKRNQNAIRHRDNRESFEQYYNEVQICYESSQAYPKAAIFERNKQMIDRSDLVICAIERKSGGAAKAVKYAEQQGKKIINLFENDAVDKLL